MLYSNELKMLRIRKIQFIDLEHDYKLHSHDI
jgi:hypothetical protein